MPERLKVLITNVSLAGRSGTETYVLDLARGLLDQGHLPIVYSTFLGDTAAELRRDTIPVVDQLSQIATAPDVIHGQHSLETMTALLHFPEVPAVYVCHDSNSWRDIPPRFPRIRRYVAVDDNCLDRMVYEYGIPQDQTRVLLNAVDLSRFKPRPALPPRPRKALVFGNAAFENSYVLPVREGSSRHGLSLDVASPAAGRPLTNPESVLGGYDIVFAKARCALEALAVGCAVILCDASGMGPMVTSAEFSRLRRLNFGARVLRDPVTADSVAQEVSRYDPADAEQVSRKIRSEAGASQLISQLIELYREVLEEPSVASPEEELAAAARYLGSLRQQMEERKGLSSPSAMVRARHRLLNSRILGFAMHRLVRRLDGYRWR